MSDLTERDLVEALADLRPDAEDFRGAVERKLSERTERAGEEEARSSAWRRAAAVLPLDPGDLLGSGLPGGVAVAVLGKKLGAASGALGVLALPAVSLAMLGLGFVAAVRSILRAERAGSGPRGGAVDEPEVDAARVIRGWWLEHYPRAAAVAVVLLLVGRVWPAGVVLALLVGSMGAVTLLIKRLAASGQVTRRAVGDFTANLLGALLGLALIFDGVVETLGAGMPSYWVPALLFLGCVLCDLFGTVRSWPQQLLRGGVPVLLVGGWLVMMGRTAHPAGADEVVAYVERGHPGFEDTVHWVELGCIGDWLESRGLEADLTRVRSAVDDSFSAGQVDGVSKPFVLSGAARAGALTEARWRELAADPQTAAMLEREGPVVDPGLIDVRVRSLVRGSMSEAQRDHLAARLRSSWPEPGAPRALRTMVGLVALGELIERPFDPSDEAWRDSAHRALLAHRIEGHGAFADHAGQFGDGAPGRKMERPLLEPTHAAVRLMRHFDVPDGIDPVAAVRYLERMATPSLVEATAPRAWGLLTVQDYRYHGAVALAELRELLGDSEANVELERLDRARALVVTRILLATLALVALCLFATLRARPGPSRAAVPG